MKATLTCYVDLWKLPRKLEWLLRIINRMEAAIHTIKFLGLVITLIFQICLRPLKKDDKKLPCRAETPVESPSITEKINASGNYTSLHILDSGDEELVNILQSFEMEKNTLKAANVINERLESYFCSKTVLNLSKKVLTETEIRVLVKGLGFTRTPTEINETDLRADFNEFARKRRCKWFSCNEPT